MSSEDAEMRAKVQLLKAYMQTKNNLNYQISQLKIKNSYRQSNTDFRDFKDMSNLTKILQKKLQDVKAIHSAVKIPEIQNMSIGSIGKLIEIIMYSEDNMGEIDKIWSENFTSERYISLLHEKLNQVNEIYQAKARKYQENEETLKANASKHLIVNDLEEENYGYNAEVQILKSKIEEISEKKQKMRMKRRKSYENIKIFHQLSDKALRLRSKLVFKEEMVKNVKQAEVELEYHSQKIEKERQRLDSLENESEETSKFVSQYEIQLEDLNNEIIELEAEIQESYEEMEELRRLKGSKSAIEEIKNQEENEVTLSLTGLLTGFEKMKDDKKSLIEANNELKKRISNLFSSKT